MDGLKGIYIVKTFFPLTGVISALFAIASFVECPIALGAQPLDAADQQEFASLGTIVFNNWTHPSIDIYTKANQTQSASDWQAVSYQAFEDYKQGQFRIAFIMFINAGDQSAHSHNSNDAVSNEYYAELSAESLLNTDRDMFNKVMRWSELARGASIAPPLSHQEAIFWAGTANNLSNHLRNSELPSSRRQNVMAACKNAAQRFKNLAPNDSFKFNCDQ